MPQSHPETSPRAQLRALFATGLHAADPQAGVLRALDAVPLPKPTDGRHIVIALGKAAGAMMRATLTRLPDRSDVRALVVTNYENATPIAGCTVIAAGHPVPDENGLRAAQMVCDWLAEAGPQDHVLCLISGGGSALLPAPKPGLRLADKARVNSLLLAGGYDIKATNLVRQHLSCLKGGGLARLAAPARLRALILSDVIGDTLSAIASGPTCDPLGSAQDAIATLRSGGTWQALPDAAKACLERAARQPLPKPLTHAHNTLIGSNRRSLEAIAQASPQPARIVSDHLTGDVQDAARRIIAAAKSAAPNTLLIWGGETTVTLTGSGTGGRNQELALRVAAGAQGIPGDWAFLSGGTDGRDGPTDAAGGIVDAATCTRLAATGLDLSALLADNDSNRALAATDDLLITGASGTNVADIQLFLRLA